MDRRTFVATLAGSLLAGPLTAEAQQAAGKVVRIGLLDFGTSNSSTEARWRAFREQLLQLGYVEGKSVIFEPRWGNGQGARLQSLAAELVRAKADVIVSATGDAALAAKQATSSIPIVTATAGDPVEMGLIASLARPGGNVTGVYSLSISLTGKRLELLKQLIPKANRIAILHDPDNRSSDLVVRDAESVGNVLGLAVRSVDASGRGDFAAPFAMMKRDQVGAVLLGTNTPYVARRTRIAKLAILHRLPMMAPAREFAEAGALLSYGTDYPDEFRRAATYVDKILKGAKPADLPVEEPTKFQLVINLKTAKALGLEVPPQLIAQADELIE